MPDRLTLNNESESPPKDERWSVICVCVYFSPELCCATLLFVGVFAHFDVGRRHHLADAHLNKTLLLCLRTTPFGCQLKNNCLEILHDKNPSQKCVS